MFWRLDVYKLSVETLYAFWARRIPVLKDTIGLMCALGNFHEGGLHFSTQSVWEWVLLLYRRQTCVSDNLVRWYKCRVFKSFPVLFRNLVTACAWFSFPFAFDRYIWHDFCFKEIFTVNFFKVFNQLYRVLFGFNLLCTSLRLLFGAGCYIVLLVQFWLDHYWWFLRDNLDLGLGDRLWFGWLSIALLD